MEVNIVDKTEKGQAKEAERRRAERVPVRVPVEFIVDADLVQARSVDLSETGLRFSTDSAIPIVLRMTLDDVQREHRGQLVWARRDAQGHMDYGIEFLDANDDPGVISSVKI